MTEQIVDVAILTVIPPELGAARAGLHVSRDAGKKDDDGSIYYRAAIHSELKKRAYQFILTCIGAAGVPEAANATTEIIQKYRPRAALLMGIAAGIRGPTKI